MIPGIIHARCPIYRLAGVLIGAVISTWASWRLNDRQEQVAREREERKRQTELRRAARLLDHELVLALTFIGRARAFV